MDSFFFFGKLVTNKIRKKYEKIIYYFVRQTQVFGFVKKKNAKKGFFKEPSLLSNGIFGY